MTNLRMGNCPIEMIVEDSGNVNTHDAFGHESIRKSIERFGVRKPIVVGEDNRVCYAGNETLRVMRELGLTEVPVAWLPADMIENERRGYAIADNQVGRLSSFDWDLLEQVVQKIDIDFAAMGFKSHEMDKALELMGENQEEALSDMQQVESEARCQLGDVWELGGKHLIYCGDCRDTKMVLSIFSEKANGIMTSPPYAEQRKQQYESVKEEEYGAWFENVQETIGQMLLPDGSFFLNIKAHCQDGQRSLYVMRLVLDMVERWGWKFIDELCWLRIGIPGKYDGRFKNGFEPVYHFAKTAPGKIRFNPQAVSHESDLAFVGDGQAMISTAHLGTTNKKQAYYSGRALPTNVIDIKVNVGKVGHFAAFPTRLPAFFMEAYSDKNDLWLDPFMGSGSTLIAAEQCGRRCYGVEISPEFVNTVLSRYQSFYPQQDVQCVRRTEETQVGQTSKDLHADL